MIYYNKSYVNAVSLSQNILLYKFNTFLILLRYLSHIVATTFAIWGVRANVAQISSSFFTTS